MLDELTDAAITALIANNGKVDKPKTGSFVIFADGTKTYRSTPTWLVGGYTKPDRYKAPRSISGKARNNPQYLLESDVVAYVARPKN